MARIAPKARAAARPSAKARARPLPRPLVETYYLTEVQFRRRAAELEEDPRFAKLVEKGVLERVRLRGKIPRHKYEDYKDRELVEFFERYRITDTPGWKDDFFDPGAFRRRQELARKYACPVGELCRILRYCNYLYDLTDGGPARAVGMDEEATDFLRFTPSEEVFDLEPIVTKLERFTSRYDLEREDFARLFFSQERDPDEVAEQVGCSRAEVDAVREMVDRVQTLSSLSMDVGPSTMAEARPRGAGKQEPVAEVYLDEAGAPQLRILADELYDVRYRFHDGDAGQEETDGASLTKREQELVRELKAVNQRKTVLVRLVSFLFRFQYRFLATGDELDLVPLTQARVARELDEEEATVSRLIRDKMLRTPWGTYPLKYFHVRTGRVVELLITVREAGELERGERARPYTDKELQEILRREYGVELSRRSITYHRNRRQKRSNYYARKRKAG